MTEIPRPSPLHVADHFFQGICICPCKRCTVKVQSKDKPKVDLVQCICKDCPAGPCGMKLEEASDASQVQGT